MATAEKSRKRPSKDESGSNKKKRRRAQEDDADIDTQAGLNKAFERMDGQLLADHLAQKTRRFGTDLSSIELSDLDISGEGQHTRAHTHACSLLEKHPPFFC